MQVLEAVQFWEREITGAKRLGEAVEAHPEFVGQVRAKGVVLVDRHQVKFVGLRSEKHWKRRHRVDTHDAVVNVAATNLIFRRDVVVHARGEKLRIIEARRYYCDPRCWNRRIVNPCDWRTPHTRYSACRHVLLELGNVRGRESGSGIDCGDSRRRWRAHRACSAGLPERDLFIIAEKEEFIFEDRTTDLAADTVEVIARPRG